MRVSSSSTLLLVLAFVLGRVNASSKSFLGQRQDETTVGTNPKYAITHQAAKAEEEVYWSRLMQETTMSVAPTPTLEPPTPRPPTSPVPLAPSPEAITQGPTLSPAEPPTEVPVAPVPAPAIPTVQPVETPPAPVVKPTPEPVIPTVQPAELTPSPVEQTPSSVDPTPAPTPTASSLIESPVPTDAPPTIPSPTEILEEVPTEAPPTGNPPTDSPLSFSPTSRPTSTPIESPVEPPIKPPPGLQTGQSCEYAIGPLPVDGSITTGSNENGIYTSFGTCDEAQLYYSTDVSGQSSWYSFVGTGRRMVVSTCTEETPSMNTVLALFNSSSGQCNDLTCVAPVQFKDGNACSENSLATTIYFDSTEGTTYYVAIIGYQATVGSFGLYVADSNTVCDNSDVPSLLVDGSVTTGSNENGIYTSFGTCDEAQLYYSTDVSGQSSWYSFVGTGRRMVVSTCTEETPSMNTVLALFNSSSGQCNDLTCVAPVQFKDGNACYENGLATTISFDSTEGTTYYVAIIGYQATVGSFGLYVAN
jgi:hypothetical protein